MRAPIVVCALLVCAVHLAQAQSFTFSFPTLGAVLFAGRRYNITWTPRIVGEVVLVLAIDSLPFPVQATYETLEGILVETVTGSTGSYLWTVRACVGVWAICYDSHHVI